MAKRMQAELRALRAAAKTSVAPALAPGTFSALGNFHVLAGAYADKSLKSTLSHVAEVDATGYPVRTLCNRVDVDHLCPDYAARGAPTCPVCLRRAGK